MPCTVHPMPSTIMREREREKEDETKSHTMGQRERERARTNETREHCAPLSNMRQDDNYTAMSIPHHTV